MNPQQLTNNEDSAVPIVIAPRRSPLPPVVDPLTGLVPLLTIRQVASYLNKSTRTVFRYVRSRKLSAIKLDGDLRFKYADIERFVEKRYLRAA